MRPTIRYATCGLAVIAACALSTACVGSATNTAAAGPADHARPVAKTTCPQAVISGGLPGGLVLSNRTLYPFSASTNGVRTTYTNSDGSFRVQVISGGFVDDISEEYDDLDRMGSAAVGRARATVYAGVFDDTVVSAAIWRQQNIAAPCDVHAIIAVGLTPAQFTALLVKVQSP